MLENGVEGLRVVRGGEAASAEERGAHFRVYP